MKYRILFPLYLFFLFYRLLYWGMSTSAVTNVYSNSLADTLVSFLTAILINRSIKALSKVSYNTFKQIATTVLIFVVSCFALWGIHWFIYTYTGGMQGVFAKTFEKLTFQFFDVITLLFIGVSVSFAWLKNVELKKRAEAYNELIEEKREAELNFLKAQINPHFIFNTLNAINFSIHKDNHEARALVSDFADLFRFQLYESNMDFILLESELEFINKYIKINKVRMSETFEVEYKQDGDLKRKYIPPLILIPFIENAFKHASNEYGKKTRIEIAVQVEASKLNFKINNTKGNKKDTVDHVGGVGLENVKKRLNILFSKNYSLTIADNKSFFNIELEIPLKNEVLHH